MLNLFRFFSRQRAPRAHTRDAATADIFRVEHHGKDWRLVLKSKLRTTDARKHPMVYRRPTSDVVLTADPQPKNPHMLGSGEFTGFSTKKLDAMSNAQAERAVIDTIKYYRDYLAKRSSRDGNYGNSLGNGSNTGTMRESGFGSHGTGGYAGPEREVNLGSTAEPQDVQRANEDFWDSIGNRYITRDTRRGAGLIASINSANARLWANPEPFRFGREWGKVG